MLFVFSAAHLVARFACAFLFAAHLYRLKRERRRRRGSREGSNESDRLLDPFPDIPRLQLSNRPFSSVVKAVDLRDRGPRFESRRGQNLQSTVTEQLRGTGALGGKPSVPGINR